MDISDIRYQVRASVEAAWWTWGNRRLLWDTLVAALSAEKAGA